MTSIKYFLGLGTVEKIDDRLTGAGTSMTADNGAKAAAAIAVLNARELSSAVQDLRRSIAAMDKGSARLQRTAIIVSAIGIPVGAFLGALFGSWLGS